MVRCLPRRRALTLAATAAATVALASACTTNPATGGHNVVLTTAKGEQEQAKRVHLQIIQFYGLYEDQAVQDYVQRVGARVAAQTPIVSWNFKFFVLDDDEVNAFAPGGGYVYIHRGLMNYLGSEAQLATVLGHEIGHDVARHPARAQMRGVLMSVGAVAAAIASGSEAIAQMANIGATAWLQGYGRDNEMEADRLGLEYAAKAGYRPEAMADVFKVLKSQESFELQRAKDESREPNIYHGVFSDHPAPDARVIQATRGAAHIAAEPPAGWIDNRDAYMQAINGLLFGSSREQGIVRDNRFYDEGMSLTVAFQTLHHLKPAEYPLAQPYRLKIVTASDTTKLEDYVKNVPGDKFQQERLELLNGLYPKGEPRAGDSVKVVE